METSIKYKDITISVKMVTPEAAKRILDNHNSNNRNLTRSHVRTLATNMRKGTWRFNGDTIRFDNEGNLIDGQNRLAALIEYGQPLPFIVCSGFDNDVIKTIDQEIKKRSLNDLFVISHVANGNNMGALIQVHTKLHLGFRSIQRRDRSHSGLQERDITAAGLTMDDLYNQYFDHENTYQIVFRHATHCTKVKLKLTRATVGGIEAFLILDKKHDTNTVLAFFEELFYPKENIPVVAALRNILINNLTAAAKIMSPDMTSLLALTWNYYICGNRNITRLRNYIGKRIEFI